MSGTAHFTADSARVLIVDATARFRWFRLPSGKAEETWTFDEPPSFYASNVQAVSADGGVILYRGKAGGAEEKEPPPSTHRIDEYA